MLTHKIIISVIIIEFSKSTGFFKIVYNNHTMESPVMPVSLFSLFVVPISESEQLTEFTNNALRRLSVLSSCQGVTLSSC